MIVQRFTAHIKPGKWDEAIEWIEEFTSLFPFFPCRIYAPHSAPFNTMMFDNVAENEAELAKMWDRVYAIEEWAPLQARWG